MMTNRDRVGRWVRLAIAAAGLLGAAAPGARAEYVLTDLGTLGGSTSLAAGIDARGGVVGSSTLVMGGVAHAFVYRDGQMMDLSPATFAKEAQATAISPNGSQIVGEKVREDIFSTPYAISFSTGSPLAVPGLAVFSGANGVNDKGQAVGLVHDPLAGTDRAFLSSGGLGTVLGTLGGGFTSAYGINNAGQVVGESAGHAVLWQGGQVIDLGDGIAHAINASGQIVGESASGAVLWQGTTSTLLGDGVAYAVNSLGQAVGSAGGSAVLYRDGDVIDLNTLIPPDWFLFEAMGINDAGQIAANGIDPNGQTHAVLLSPVAPPAVPEPTSLVLLALGAAGVLTLRRRDRPSAE